MSENSEVRQFWIASQADDLSLSEDIICFEEKFTKNFDASFTHVIEYAAYAKVKNDLRMALEIGVEQQRRVNRSLTEVNKSLKSQIDELLNCVKFYADVNNWETPTHIKDPDHLAEKTLTNFRKRYGWES